jgi:hypothetical protein
MAAESENACFGLGLFVCPFLSPLTHSFYLRSLGLTRTLQVALQSSSASFISCNTSAALWRPRMNSSRWSMPFACAPSRRSHCPPCLLAGCDVSLLGRWGIKKLGLQARDLDVVGCNLYIHGRHCGRILGLTVSNAM